MVVHANHPQEIDDATAAALSRLVDAGIPVLNQSVLLRGVNDNAEALIGLSRRLVDLRVMPYYLHQLDRVSGAAHFEVPISRGLELIDPCAAPSPATPSRATSRRFPATSTSACWRDGSLPLPLGEGRGESASNVVRRSAAGRQTQRGTAPPTPSATTTLCPNGATYDSPGRSPGYRDTTRDAQAPTGRNIAAKTPVYCARLGLGCINGSGSQGFCPGLS